MMHVRPCAARVRRLALTLVAGWACSPLGACAEPPADAEATLALAKAAVPVAAVEASITAADVREHIEFLADERLRGRPGGDAREAAEYLVERFRKCGLQPLFDDESWYQAIPGKAGDDGKRPTVGRNVGAWLPGRDPELRDEYVIVAAHYDHLGVRDGRTYRGADDNASGVSMMLEVARRLKDSGRAPKRSVVFVGFDLEERMLWGSRWFAAHPPWPLERVKFFLTADMIGRSLGDLPLPTVFALGSEHSPEIVAALDAIEAPDGLELAILGIDLIGPAPRSDYGPFMARKVPFLFFSTGEHPDYHTPRDVPERIDYEKVAGVSEFVLRLTRHVADADQAPQWIDDIGTNVEEARALHRVASLLLEADGERRLTDFQRLIVTQAAAHSKRIVERGSMTAGERTWLTRLSQLMLLSVF